MNAINRKRWLILLLVFVLILPVAASPAGATPRGQGGPEAGRQLYLPLLFQSGAQVRLDSLALQDIADQTGIPIADLQMLASATTTYPLSGATAVSFKVQSAIDGAIYGVMLSPSGEVVDAAALDAAELAAYEEQYGKLDSDLAAYLAQDSSGQPVDVIVWVKTSVYQQPARLPLAPPEAEDVTAAAQVEVHQAAVDAQRAEFVTSATAATAEQLASMGLPADADLYVPVVRSTMSPTQIMEVANWPEVDRIYLAPIAYAEAASASHALGPTAPEMEVARTTTGVDIVHGRNILGFGVKLGQSEVGGRVAENNPFLDGFDADRVVNNNANVCAAASGHSTGVAGIMMSSHPARFGIAPGARLYTGGSCGGVTADLQSAITAAVNWGAVAINNSWGSLPATNKPTATDKFFDTIVHNNWRVMVKSAGNEAGPCNSGTGKVTSPGLGYNMITVGNFDDLNTNAWPGDVMNNCSSFVDPASNSGDREKPEIAAPGTNINSTTTAAPWTGGIGSGTSFAAPVINGAAGLLMQREPGLRQWPETVKAILMATATHNIEGDVRLSEKDGAGALYMPYADEVAQGIRGNREGQGYSCATVTPLVKTISLVAGKRTRVVIVWDQNPTYASYDSKPSADLDLVVKNPSGVAVASSTSWDNTYEIVDFTPAVNGNYRVEILRFRCDLTPDWLGWAWWRAP